MPLPQILVQLSGEHVVGRLAIVNGTSYFEYDPAFIRSGHELSPLHLPLQSGVFECRKPHLLNLPGLCFDSLPDDWGKKVATRWFAARQTPGEIHPYELLCFVGPRGIGALTYTPDLHASTPLRPALAEALDLRLIEDSASGIAANDANLPELEKLAANGSAGGARPKMWASIMEDPTGGPPRIVAGANKVPDGFSPYLLKFDLSTVESERREYGLAEHAYALMARAAGIRIPDTKIIRSTMPDGHVRSHFAIARYDRLAGNRRVHFHSFAGIAELDFDAPHDYRDLMEITDRVTRDQREVREVFRRMVFNVLARVRDDHAKNHGFLYTPEAPALQRWKLAPAFDVCFASPGHFLRHALSIAGEAVNPTKRHVLTLADEFSVNDAGAIIEEVSAAVAAWPTYAKNAGLSDRRANEIQSHQIPYAAFNG